MVTPYQSSLHHFDCNCQQRSPSVNISKNFIFVHLSPGCFLVGLRAVLVFDFNKFQIIFEDHNHKKLPHHHLKKTLTPLFQIAVGKLQTFSVSGGDGN